MPNIHDQAREFLSNEKLGLFFSNEKKEAIFLFADWVSEQSAQQSVQSDKCPACDGKGWFGAQFCEGEECPTCEGTGIRR